MNKMNDFEQNSINYINDINISKGILSLENIYGMLLPRNQGLNWAGAVLG